jgi:hypothetical protein
VIAARAFLHVAAVVAVAVGLAAAPRAQSAAAPDLQAAFLLNFARFTEWPGDDGRRPIVLCVFGDARVAAALLTSLRGQSIEGRQLMAREVDARGDITPCHVLFVGKSSIGAGGPLLITARRLPVLTVSDREGFAESAGIIELFIENGRMRFAVNVDVARGAELHLSSRLLGLARIVRGTHAR